MNHLMGGNAAGNLTPALLELTETGKVLHSLMNLDEIDKFEIDSIAVKLEILITNPSLASGASNPPSPGRPYRREAARRDGKTCSPRARVRHPRSGPDWPRITPHPVPEGNYCPK